jgi:hypothetical protein
MAIIIDPSNSVRKVAVRLGLQNEQLNEVTGGLAEGQLVATSRLSDLTDGVIVAPRVESTVALAGRP